MNTRHEPARRREVLQASTKKLLDLGSCTCASRVCYPHRDALSTIGLVTNTVGAIGLRQRFQPFGDRDTTFQSNCGDEERGFTGATHDPSSALLYLNARWYDPAHGRFIQPDWWDPIATDLALKGGPAGFRTSPVGTNRYAYAGIDHVDAAPHDPGPPQRSSRQASP